MSTLPQMRLLESAHLLCTSVGHDDPTLAVSAFDDDRLLSALAAVSEAQRALQVLGALVSAEVSRRSERELGYDGLAQRKGHRTGTDLVQSVTGQSRADVRRATAAGNDLRAVAGDDADAASGEPVESGADRPPVPWFAPLAEALRAGALSREQYDVIRRGLGEPPVERYRECESHIIVEAWRTAAVTLLAESSDRGVEDLASDSRLARDTLDPIGVQLRFDERFERRSLRTWIDHDGQHHARIAFDDDAAVWVHTILNAALRPRRGPRFADPASASAPDPEVPDPEMPDDRRSNEQLQYDTLIAILRTGAAADPAQAFGDRQPGVRIIVTEDALPHDVNQHPGGTAFAEETRQALPTRIAERYLCDAGSKTITVGAFGTPLDVGRDRRLFTKRQRDALALRDGGCRWCGAEPSRCEAHHLRHWHEHRGRTDLADGVLLCRNCHMRLHNQGWLITRDGSSYHLHPPDGRAPRLLRTRSLLRYQKAAPILEERQRQVPSSSTHERKRSVRRGSA